MRKIRLTESELISFIKEVIKESRYSHDFQSYEDAILDKISDEGIETLSEIEKYILDSIGKENFDSQPVMLMLAKKIAKQDSLTDIEQMFYDDNSVESSEEDVRGYRELEPGVLFDAGDDIESLMLLCAADITSKNQTKVKRYLQGFEFVKVRLQEVEEKDSIRNWQPPITGEMIMQIFNITPSKQVGIIKDAIREAILDGIIPNEYEAAYQFMIAEAAKIGLHPAL
jgi:hypothetical protein